MEAIGHAGTCLGILSNDGILLAAERRNTNKLLDEVRYPASEASYGIGSREGENSAVGPLSPLRGLNLLG